MNLDSSELKPDKAMRRISLPDTLSAGAEKPSHLCGFVEALGDI